MPQTFPVFPISVRNSRRREYGAGNAVLIDRENGIFATNAHVVSPAWDRYKNLEHGIYLPHAERLYKAESNKDWINWETDVAYLRLSEDLSAYSQPIKKVTRCEDWKSIQLVGYEPEDITPFTLSGFVMKGRSHSGISMPALQRMWDMEKRSFVKPRDRLFIYKNYIYFRSEGIVAGMSGAALVDQDNRLVGILSQGAGDYGLAIPSSELSADCVLAPSRARTSTLPTFLRSLSGNGWQPRQT